MKASFQVISEHASINMCMLSLYPYNTVPFEKKSKKNKRYQPLKTIKKTEIQSTTKF